MSLPADLLHPPATNPTPAPTMPPQCPPSTSPPPTVPHAPHAPLILPHAPPSSTYNLNRSTPFLPSHNQSPIADLAQMFALQVQNQQRMAFQHQKMIEEQARQQDEQAKQQQTMLSLLNTLIHRPSSSPDLQVSSNKPSIEQNPPQVSSALVTDVQGVTEGVQGPIDGVYAVSNLQTHNITDSVAKMKNAVQFGEVLVQEFAINAHSDTIDAQLLAVLQKQNNSPPNAPSSSKNPPASSQVDGNKNPSLSSENIDSNKEVSPPSVLEKIPPTSSPMVVVSGADAAQLAPKNCNSLLPSGSFSAQGTAQGPMHSLSTSAPLAAVTVHRNVTPNAATAVPTPTVNSATKQSFASLLKPKAIPPIMPVTQLPTPYKKGHLMAVKLDEEVYQRSLQHCQNNLHGKLILHRGKPPIKAFDLHISLSNVWQTKNHWTLTPIGRGFYTVRFSNVEDKQKVWASGQTTLKDGVFNLFHWTKDFKPSQQKQTRAHVWARLHEVPEEYMHFHLIMSMANVIGHPVTIDPYTLKKEFGHYCRVEVDVDLKSVLPNSILVEREGFNFEVEVSYEKIPDFCSHCSVIGHLVTACRTIKKAQQQAEGNAKSVAKSVPKPKAVQSSDKTPINTNTSHPSHDQPTLFAHPSQPDHTQPALHDSAKVSHETHSLKNLTSPSQQSNLHPISSSALKCPSHVGTALVNAGLIDSSSTYSSTPLITSPTVTDPCSVNNCHTPPSPHNDHLPIHIPPSPPAVNDSSHQRISSHTYSAAASSSGSSETSIVPCSLTTKKLTKSDKQKQLHYSCSFYKQTTPTPSTNRSLSASHNSFRTKHRLHNQFEPLTDLLLEGDGEGESWNIFENSDEEVDNSASYNEENYQAVHSISGSQFAPPILNAKEALDWGTMADDEPIPSWEATADAAFADALAKTDASNRCTQLEQNDSVPSPVQTRAQRQKKGATLSLNKNKKLKKTSIKEKKEIEAAAPGKPPEAAQSNSFSSSQPLYQWQVHLQDKKKREEIAVVDQSVNV